MDIFNLNERNDYQLLKQFNEQTKLFKTLRPTKPCSPTDAVGKSRKRTFNIELKHRYCSSTTFPTVYIEDYKLAQMLLDYQLYNCEPLYINFYSDAVVIFNLSKLEHRPEVEIKNIYSNGKEKNQMQERRYCLNLEDAVIYQENKLVKAMGEKWQTNS